jgi:hypothetical protein
MKFSSSTFLSALLLAAACTGGDDGDDQGTTEVSGQAQFRDATTAPDGEPAEPAAPPAQEMDVTLVVEGQGDIPEIDPQCALDPAGAFEAHLVGDAVVDDDGAYLATLGSGAVDVTTPSGCEIPELSGGVVTDITLRAELAATTQNCDTYCAASARADAEAECAGEPDEAQCRGEAEAAFAAACTTTCSTETHVIVAEVSIGAGALGELDLEALQAAALGQFEAELTFDHMEDEAGNTLDP